MQATPTIAVYIARALRDFGDSYIAILLPVYLAVLGLTPFEIGLAATLALLGSALTTLAMGTWGGPYGHRRLLILASALMCLTGALFAMSHGLLVILLVAFLGTINPTSGSVSIFMPLEHAVLTDTVTAQQRTRMFSVYSIIGTAAGAAGALAAALPDQLATLGLAPPDALRAMFYLYAALGICVGVAYQQLPIIEPASRTTKSGLGPSRAIVYKLAALFSVDSFAGGFAVQSLLALWLFQRFHVSLETASLFFFWSGLLSAASYPAAAWLAARIGLVNTMVYTHIPASLCLIAAAFANSAPMALGLLLIRSALAQMDVPARSSYVMAVVTPEERAAAASVTSVPRSLATAASPALAGAMFAAGLDALPFILCGVLKIAYDIALLWFFRHVRPPEEVGHA